MDFNCGEVERALKKKGFENVAGSKDHRFYALYVNGERTNIRTKVSHNSQTIHEGLIKSMRNQVHLSKEDFIDLIKCPLSKEEYIEKLKEQNLIQFK